MLRNSFKCFLNSPISVVTETPLLECKKLARLAFNNTTNERVRSARLSQQLLYFIPLSYGNRTGRVFSKIGSVTLSVLVILASSNIIGHGMTTDINVLKSKTADFIHAKKSLKTNQQKKQKAKVGKRITRNALAIEASAIACTVSVDKDSFGFTGRTSFLFVPSTKDFTSGWLEPHLIP